MQIVEISLPQNYFYNPTSGELISLDNGIINDESMSLKGWWNDEIIDEPSLFDEDFANQWENALEMYEYLCEEAASKGKFYMDYQEMLEKFLLESAKEDWAAFKVETTEFSCGPLQTTNWYVIDLSLTE